MGPRVRLSKLNGWQRLWLVATGLALTSFGLIYPLMITGQSDIGQWDYRRAIVKDFGDASVPRIRRALSYNWLSLPTVTGEAVGTSM